MWQRNYLYVLRGSQYQNKLRLIILERTAYEEINIMPLECTDYLGESLFIILKGEYIECK